MSSPAGFLTSFAQAIATMALYRDGHPARERALDGAYELLLRLQEEQPHLVFTFIGDEIVCGLRPVRELRAWDWGNRLAEAGIQRLEFQPGVTRAEFEGFLDDVLARLAIVAINTAEARQFGESRIKFGSVGVRGEVQPRPELEIEPLDLRFDDEADALHWLHDEVLVNAQLHLSEAEAVVRSLSAAMHSQQQMLVPLLQLRNFDEYTTTHAMNVSVLSMGLAQYVGLAPRDVRTFGVAGLLHDIGKVRVPHEVLTKPGKLTDAERAIMNNHTVEGARIIIETQDQLDMAAVVAYEHHIMLNGGGYPGMRYRRDCHYASKVVHVCDVYDALRTNRPYREAWPADKVLAYINEKAGVEFDAVLAQAFTRMMQEWEPRLAEADIKPIITARNAAEPSPETA